MKTFILLCLSLSLPLTGKSEPTPIQGQWRCEGGVAQVLEVSDGWSIALDREHRGELTVTANLEWLPEDHEPCEAGLAFTTVTEGRMGGGADGDRISLEEQGYMGLVVLRVYYLTGKAAYKDYVLRMAEALLRLQRPEGNWDYRINPRTGEASGGFTANVVDNILFFDEIYRMTGIEAYRESSQKAWKWVLEVPLPQNRWLGIFADVGDNVSSSGEDNYAPWVAQWAARYLLGHTEESQDAIVKAETIREWIVSRFLHPDANGFRGIAEQAIHLYVMPGHNFRQAMLEADLYERTGKEDYRAMALHLMDASMYYAELNGLVRTYLHPLSEPTKDETGWSRNAQSQAWWSNQLWTPSAYLYVMGAFPERAPQGENHLLRTSAPLSMVSYETHAVKYRTVRESEDRLAVISKPARVQSNGRDLPFVEDSGLSEGWSFDPAVHLLKVHHTGGDVVVQLEE